MQLPTALASFDIRITGGSDYLWNCFGDAKPYLLESDNEHCTLGVVFDTHTQRVLIFEAWDKLREREYIWIEPTVRDAYEQEHKDRGFVFLESMDDKRFTEVDVEEDILEKAQAMHQGLSYDERVLVNVDMDDAVFLKVARAAHEMDVTINEFAERALEEFVNNHKHLLEESKDATA